MQMQVLLDALRSRDRNQPIVVAGDMNTSGLDVNRLIRSVLRRPWLAFWSPSIEMLEKVEPVFALLRHEGYEYRDCNLDQYTLRDRGYRAHLDWFFIKNVERSRMRNAAIYRAFEGRRRFSDHVPIAVELL
jgi:endonuclease/exonuclease/phosphatase family metal-dependent hydrolase